MPGLDEGQPVVLVTEDEALLLGFCCRELQAAGMEVLSARSGDEAVLRMAEHKGIDVLFTDIRLPGSMDGWSLAELFQAAYPASGVI